MKCERKFSRKCPECKEDIFYVYNYMVKIAEENGTLCRSCRGKKSRRIIEYKKCTGCDKMIDSRNKFCSTKCFRHSRKNKTWEELYGEEKAAQLKKQTSENNIHNNPNFKCSLEIYIKKYGDELGKIKYQERIDKMKKTQKEKKIYTPKVRKLLERTNQTYEEYKNSFSPYKIYYIQVRKLISKLPLYQLENYENRGQETGKYKLKCKISIKEGFERNMEPEKIASLDNLYYKKRTMVPSIFQSSKYYKKVQRISNSQPLYLLENHEKRGNAKYNKNAYHLDHIISIKYGFDNNIPAEIIGNIKNLRFIPYKDNVLKSDKITEEALKLLNEIYEDINAK